MLALRGLDCRAMALPSSAMSHSRAKQPIRRSRFACSCAVIQIENRHARAGSFAAARRWLPESGSSSGDDRGLPFQIHVIRITGALDGTGSGRQSNRLKYAPSFKPVVCRASVCFAADPSWEEKFRAIPDPRNLRDYRVQRLTAHPHHVGSPYDKDNAEWIAAKLKSWGFQPQIENFEVLFPTPKERLVEMVEPTRFTAKLEEPPVAADPTSNQKSEQLPVYNAYS